MGTILRTASDNNPANWTYSTSDTPTFTAVPAGSLQVGHVVWDAGGTVTADNTAPTLSSPTAAADGDTAATGTVSTNTASGTLYFAAIPTAGATPSAAQVKAGTGGDIIDATADSQAVSTTGVQNVSVSGLTASTAYKLVYAHEDAAITPNISTVSVSAEFTTDADGGANLVPDPGFDDDVNWTWSGHPAVQVTGSKLVFTAASSGSAYYELASPLAAGTYAYSFDIESYSAGSLRLRITTTGNVTRAQTSSISGDGTKTGNLVLSDADGQRLYFVLSGTPLTCNVDNFTLTLVP